MGYRQIATVQKHITKTGHDMLAKARIGEFNTSMDCDMRRNDAVWGFSMNIGSRHGRP
jgi:hypothetical protein